MKKTLLVIILLILTIALRWYKIENPVADWHSWRQADTASVSLEYFKKGVDLLHPTYHDLSNIPSGLNNPQGYRMVEFPLYNALHAYTAKLNLWSFDQSGRALSVFLSAISGLFLFLIVAYLSGTTTAFLSLFFWAVLPFNIFYSRVILPEPLMITLLLSGMYFFLVSQKDKNKYAFLHFLLSATLLALSILVKPYAAFFFLPLLWVSIHKYGWRLLLKPGFYLFPILVITPFLLWRWWISQYPAGIPASSWLFNLNGLRLRPAWWRWLFGERLAKLILGYWGLLPFGLALLVKPNKKENWFYHLWFLGVFAYFVIFAGGNVTHDYYQSIITPIVCILLAKGVNYLLRPHLDLIFTLSYPLTAITVALMLFLSWYQVRDYYQINHWSIVHAGVKADQILPQDAKVIAPYNGDTAFLYQTRRSGWPTVTYDLEKLIDEGATHYVAVNYDDTTNQILKDTRFKVLERNDQFLIVQLK